MASSVLVNGTQVLLRRRSSAPLTAGRGIEARGLPSLPLSSSSSSFASVSAGPNRFAVSKRASSVITAVAAPARSSPPGQDEDHQGPEWGSNNNPSSSSFDFSTPPPFTLADIRAAIPKHCWVKDTWRSIAYVFRDVAIVFGLAAGAAYVNSWLLWPLYWFAQGTMFWALFVIGHDCGHGSFSSSKAVNNVIGHLTHSSILVPYHGWRISHRTHHQNHGHVDNDESWHPLPESAYRNLDPLSKLGRFSILSMFAYPLYLWRRSPGKTGSHFNPESPLFHPSERSDVITSSVCCAVMVGLLAALTVVMGPLWMFKLYVVPYLMNVVWLDAVTYLHHHGHEDKVPWYRGQEWNYMRGGLSTIDRDYGLFNNIHHDIGTHVLHHLFPQIPHYNLIEATEAVKPVLGSFYREPDKSGPFPVHLVGALVKSLSNDHFVKDDGNVVFYESDQAKK